MGTGFALIASFITGAALMFIVSEHYYKRIEAILQLRKAKDDRIDFVDARQGEALRQGKAIRTEIRRS